jgi:A/G-specific adenine glycosylase
LVAWQRVYGRHDLPWQGADAYRVWLSEIMLQQTQVVTVIPYFQRFVASFPDINTLAAATEEQVLAHWSGLGYYARGRNLHRAAQIIANQYQGKFPCEFEQIIELPGIGRSTAAAICALAFQQRRAILDGNVKRVLARHCGIAGWTADKKIEAQLWQQAEQLLPAFAEDGRDAKSHSNTIIATYIQAQMDMGATVCTRSKPKCAQCPVQDDCVAYQTNRVRELPTPRPRKAIPEKSATLILLMHGNDILLHRRAPQGIWGGLWCLPQFEDDNAAAAWCGQYESNFAHQLATNAQQEFVGGSPDSYVGADLGLCERLPSFTHIFTHFKLHVTPVLCQIAHKPLGIEQADSTWMSVAMALQAAIPAPVRTILEHPIILRAAQIHASGNQF